MLFVHICATNILDAVTVTPQTSQVSIIEKLKNLWLDDAASSGQTLAFAERKRF